MELLPVTIQDRSRPVPTLSRHSSLFYSVKKVQFFHVQFKTVRYPSQQNLYSVNEVQFFHVQFFSFPSLVTLHPSLFYSVKKVQFFHVQFFSFPSLVTLHPSLTLLYT